MRWRIATKDRENQGNPHNDDDDDDVDVILK